MNGSDGYTVGLRARIEPATLGPGSTGVLVVEATMPEGGHIEAHEPPEPWLIPTVLDVLADSRLFPCPVRYPEPEVRTFEWSPVALRVLAGTARFEVPFKVSNHALSGELPVTARLRYQLCVDGACLPPAEQTVAATASVAAGELHDNAAGRDNRPTQPVQPVPCGG